MTDIGHEVPVPCAPLRAYGAHGALYNFSIK